MWERLCRDRRPWRPGHATIAAEPLPPLADDLNPDFPPPFHGDHRSIHSNEAGIVAVSMCEMRDSLTTTENDVYASRTPPRTVGIEKATEIDRMERQLSRQQVHETLLSILRHVVERCEAENIGYFLIGGGCLGIVRHDHSLIPWDSDLDICVHASDMARFCAAMSALPPEYRLFRKNQPVNPTWKVFDRRTCVTQDGRPRDYGVFVDVVPMMYWRSRRWKSIDGLLGRLAAMRDHADVRGGLRRIVRRTIRLSGVPKLVALFLRHGPYPKLMHRLDRECRDRKAGIVSGALGRAWQGRYPWDVIYPLGDEVLQGVRVKVPRDLGQFLRLRYGADFMQMPGMTERWTHFEAAFWCDDGR
ncbi:MAG: LicD family protein [Ectothiorhodospiraceae bacterium]|jgi:lipopolysaccharide cholinephosphotransferase|nr:LicD family protein [Ectothiorhodospiraceae bacterium]